MRENTSQPDRQTHTGRAKCICVFVATTETKTHGACVSQVQVGRFWSQTWPLVALLKHDFDCSLASTCSAVAAPKWPLHCLQTGLGVLAVCCCCSSDFVCHVSLSDFVKCLTQAASLAHKCPHLCNQLNSSIQCNWLIFILIGRRLPLCQAADAVRSFRHLSKCVPNILSSCQ